jgi:hypothetical protein
MPNKLSKKTLDSIAAGDKAVISGLLRYAHDISSDGEMISGDAFNRYMEIMNALPQEVQDQYYAYREGTGGQASKEDQLWNDLGFGGGMIEGMFGGPAEHAAQQYDREFRERSPYGEIGPAIPQQLPYANSFEAGMRSPMGWATPMIGPGPVQGTRHLLRAAKGLLPGARSAPVFNWRRPPGAYVGWNDEAVTGKVMRKLEDAEELNKQADPVFREAWERAASGK